MLLVCGRHTRGHYVRVCARGKIWSDSEFAYDLSPSSVYTHIKIWAEKIHNLVILNTPLCPHGIVRINKKYYGNARKKNRHQRRSLCINHSCSIRCRHIIIIQSQNTHFIIKYTDIKKEDLTDFLHRACIYVRFQKNYYTYYSTVHRPPYIYPCHVRSSHMYHC